MKRIALLILISLMIITGCNTAQKPKPVETKSEPKPDETVAERAPLRQPEGQLKVQLRPANAKVDITSLGETDGIIPVIIKVQDYGNNNGNPNNAKSLQVGILLTKPHFLSQRYEIYEPIKEGTATLVRLSLEKGHRKDTFQRASRVYELPMAYPSYIPAGFALERAEFQDHLPTAEMPSWLIFLVWTKGDQTISMRFLPKGPKFRGGLRGLRGPPPNISTVTISKSLTARLDGRGNIDFVVKDQDATWDMEIHGLPKRETIKILKGIKLVK